MPSYKAAALARHEYLLSRFESFPLPGSKRCELRFVGNLPRAATIQDAVNAAMTEAGIPIPEGFVTLTQEKVHQVKHLLSLFVKAAPETVPALDGSEYTDVLYSYGCKRNFHTRPGVMAQEALEATCQYSPPSPIAGIRGGRNEVYENMHVALRKIADSKITSAAWNAMHVIDAGARNWMSNIVVTALGMQSFETAEDVVAAVKAAFAADNEWRGCPHRALINCLLELFADNDWHGLLSYCIIWPYEVKKVESEPATAAALTPAPAAGQLP